MPEIEITEDQYEYLQSLQEDIQTEVVGKYAHVRTIDAVQYLIDNHEGEINAGVTDAPAGEPAATPDPSAGAADGSAGDDAAGSEAEDAGDGDESTADEDSDASGGADGAAGGGEGGAPAATPGPGAGGDDGKLSAMMQLLETHDDKWEKASGDTGYEVELPDGSTEAANTRDDVRALLFKHYE